MSNLLRDLEMDSLRNALAYARGKQPRWVGMLRGEQSALQRVRGQPQLAENELALAAAHVYERFVPYADDGWQWVTYPGSSQFDGWVYSERNQRRIVGAARLLSRRAMPDALASTLRPTHGVTFYRTRQLTGRSWTAEPGSKVWRALT